MVARVEGAHELTDFTLLCISCSFMRSSDDQVESVKKGLGEQKCDLFTRLAIFQQSLPMLERKDRGHVRAQPLLHSLHVLNERAASAVEGDSAVLRQASRP